MDSRPFPHSVRAVRHTAITATKANTVPTVPPGFVGFAVRLPFNLAIPNGSVWVMRRSVDPDEPPWVELTVHRVTVSLTASALDPYNVGLATLLGETRPQPADGISIQTWVWGVTSNTIYTDECIDPISADPALVLSTLFERILSATNRLIAAESLLTHNPWSQRIEKEALDAQVSFFHVGGEEIPGQAGTMVLHRRLINPVVQVEDAELLASKVADAVGRRLASDAARRPHPLATARELVWRACAYRLSGDYVAAVIVLQTAAEAFLRGIYRTALVDRGSSGADIDAAGRNPFQSVVATELPGLLGGSWSGSHSPVTTYWRDLYEVRNQITHAGRTPHWRQIPPAFDAFDGLVAFVEKLVAGKPRVFSRTLAAIWEPWAGGDLQLSRSAATCVERVVGESEPYWLPEDEAGR